MPYIPKRYTRNDFETALTAHKKTVKEVQELTENGVLKPEDYLYTLDDVVKICITVAWGFWDNATLQPTLTNTWGRSMRSKQTKEIIKEAFTINEKKP